jgi:hypothetical protein
VWCVCVWCVCVFVVCVCVCCVCVWCVCVFVVCVCVCVWCVWCLCVCGVCVWCVCVFVCVWSVVCVWCVVCVCITLVFQHAAQRMRRIMLSSCGLSAAGSAIFVSLSLRCKPKGRGFNSRWGNWHFSLTQSFRPHYGPGVESPSNRNEHQRCFLGCKGGRCVGLTTLPSSRAYRLEILEALTYCSPQGLSWPVR